MIATKPRHPFGKRGLHLVRITEGLLQFQA